MAQKPLISPAFAKKLMTPKFGSCFGKVMVKCNGASKSSGQIFLFDQTSDFLSQFKRVLYHKEYVFIFDRPFHRSPWFAVNLSGCDKLRKDTEPETADNSSLQRMKRFRYLARRLTNSASRHRILFKCSEATLMGQSPLSNETIYPLISNTYSWDKRDIFHQNESVEPDARVMKDVPLVFGDSFSIYKSPMTQVQQQPSASPCPENKPSKEQLEHVFNTLRNTLPKLFVQPLDYTIYHPNIIFENNLQGIRTCGLLPYVGQIAALRVIGHLKYAFVKLELLKITLHENDKTVKVRWRIRGVTTFKVFLHFWKYKFWSIDDSIAEFQETWYDGFSVYYIGEDGRVIKHVVDKIVPEEDECLAEVPSQSALAANN